MIKGIKFGIGLFAGFFLSAAFAFVVSGTVKTWTTGETLTATDLNTTVQSLKSAIEGATQYVEASVSAYQGNTTYSTFAGGGMGSLTEVQSIAPRSGTIKNARLLVRSSLAGGDCTFTLRKNSVDTAISFAVPAGSSATVTDADTVSIAAGDLLSWKQACLGTNSTLAIGTTIAFEF